MAQLQYEGESITVILRDDRFIVCTFSWTSEMLGTKASIVKASGQEESLYKHSGKGEIERTK